MADSDELLIGRIADGSEDALRDFCLRHETALFNFAKSILNDRISSADIVNETMFEVWRKAGTFRGTARPRTWLFAIPRNKAVDQLRRRKPGKFEEIDANMPDDRIEDAEGGIARGELAQRIAACLDRLKPAHREALHLAFFDDIGQVEIAVVTDCSVGTVKSRIHHAKDAMRHRLGWLEGYVS